MNKRIAYALVILFICNPLFVFSQGGCPKIKVGVQIHEINPRVFEQLNKLSKSEKSNAQWTEEIWAILIKSLTENSPDIEFIRLISGEEDHDYLFSSGFILSGQERIELEPERKIVDGDDVITIPPLYGSKYTVFRVNSSLINNSNCFPRRRYNLGTRIGESEDIYRAILSCLSDFGRDLSFILYERENERPVPPREPIVTTRLDNEYISLLSEETRKIKIYENVKSCNGRPAYGKFYHSQPVRFPRKTERGDIEPTENCKLEYAFGETQYILVNESGDAVGEYVIKRGLEPLLEKITLSTCPLGNKPNIEKEVEIIIRGLELQVEPDRNTINVGEKTTIQIDLHELDPDGTEILSCDGREVDVRVTGVVDGTISHESGKITLNEVGVAFIDYTAGEKDRQIKITATFTPPAYPEEVSGEAVIRVRKEEGDFNGTIMYQRQVHWKDEEKSTYSTVSVTVDLVEHASINVAAKYLRTISNSTGVYELFGTESLSGNFSVTMKKVSVITDHQGNWTKIVDTWQGDEMLDPETAGTILLTIEPKKYTLHPQLYFPSIDGKTVTTTSEGGHMVTDPGSWACNASFEFEGQTDGKSVNDHWSKPSTGPQAVTSQSGLIQGATWNWSLSRTNKKSK